MSLEKGRGGKNIQFLGNIYPWGETGLLERLWGAGCYSCLLDSYIFLVANRFGIVVYQSTIINEMVSLGVVFFASSHTDANTVFSR